MNIQQIYTKCLAQGAYYIESEGEVAVIDPLREIQPYIEKAQENHSKIKYIFETHFHADFVSGHLSLAEETDAKIVYGRGAQTNFDAIIAQDHQAFQLGKLTIIALHTPGHTMESTTYLLRDENDKDIAIFTGDTLFLGDVGRPDLAQKSGELTVDDLAGYLYDSLRTKIMPLADDVIVYPGHGAGSACGKNMMKETFDTLGNQKKINYALDPKLTKEDFIKQLKEGLTPPPKYFPLNVQMNKQGYQHIEKILQTGNRPLSVDEFEKLQQEKNALVLDVRDRQSYATLSISDAIFIGLNGSFAPWVGNIITDIKRNLLLVCPEGKELETVTRLARVGFDNTFGYLQGGVEAWKKAGKPCQSITSITAKAFETVARKAKVFDVRKPSEYKSQHMVNAVNTPLSDLENDVDFFQGDETFYIHCAGGYRSMIAASILKRKGIHHFIDIKEGFAGIKKTNVPLTEFICSSNF